LLPDVLETLPTEDRRDLLAILTLVCAADGELVREEMAALEGKMGQALLHPEVRREIRQMLRQPPDFDELIRGMNEKTLKLALRDAVLIAASDGGYHDSELKIVKKLAKHSGVDSDTVERLLKWVEEYWAVVAKGRAIVGIGLPGDAEILKDA
jgi:uncharacterized membrane protein YebE (DUF533 family)